ncbi:chalcone isomerase family protein [Pseudoalteromonas neustonica]|uniref:chalcone isomerase family protein n=1 Tax=Pseudoalteromonas neustonica TaxID=1840331 RepID=UPI0007DB69FB|nr:chalcone isomerase family protein [Pseudoalteromonas neustonica]
MNRFIANTICAVCLAFVGQCVSADFKTVGTSRFEYIFWDVYDATLATTTGQYEFPQHPTKLSLTYLRDFAAKDIVKATNEQWRYLGKNQLVKKYDDKLLAIWPDIKEGETLTFITTETGIGTFYHQNKELGSIKDVNFADDFLSIWLSENTSEPKMRKQLLGR